MAVAMLPRIGANDMGSTRSSRFPVVIVETIQVVSKVDNNEIPGKQEGPCLHNLKNSVRR
jgi:hypothetical protein